MLFAREIKPVFCTSAYCLCCVDLGFLSQLVFQLLLRVDLVDGCQVFWALVRGWVGTMDFVFFCCFEIPYILGFGEFWHGESLLQDL